MPHLLHYVLAYPAIHLHDNFYLVLQAEALPAIVKLGAVPACRIKHYSWYHTIPMQTAERRGRSCPVRGHSER